MSVLAIRNCRSQESTIKSYSQKNTIIYKSALALFPLVRRQPSTPTAIRRRSLLPDSPYSYDRNREQDAHNPLRAGFSEASLRHMSAAVPRSYTKLQPLRLPVRHWQNNCWKQLFPIPVADRLRQRYSDVKDQVLRNGQLQTE